MTILRDAHVLSVSGWEGFAKNTSLLMSVGCNDAHEQERTLYTRGMEQGRMQDWWFSMSTLLNRDLPRPAVAVAAR